MKEIFEEKGIDLKYMGKQLIQKKICMLKDIGVNENLFGGYMLQWIDEAAAAFVSEMIGHGRVVTLKMSEVLFNAPVHVNDIVNIDGEIKNIGKSSITIDIQVVNTNTKNLVCTCTLVFVHVDQNMTPIKINLKNPWRIR